MDTFVSRWDSWVPTVPDMAGGDTAKTDRTTSSLKKVPEGVGWVTAKTAKTRTPLEELGLPRCRHDPIFWERQRGGEWLCWKCEVLGTAGHNERKEHLV
jgi:hypothetical protein